MRAQEPVDPSQVGDDVAEILSRPEFRYEPSLFDRITDWIGERLESLFGQSAPGPGAAFGGGAPPFIAWLLILVVVGLVGLAVFYAVRNRVPRVTDDDEPTEVEIEHRRGAAEWRDDAEGHEASGEWKLAIRARYRELVRLLTDRGQLPDIAGLTTGELRRELATTTPDASVAFSRCSELFERPWYADDPTGPDQNAEFRRRSTDVLSASAVPAQDTTELMSA